MTTMLSFRVEASEAARVTAWAGRLGVERSELLRDALRRHLALLASEEDARTWEAIPLTDEETALDAVAEWGPAEEWADWLDETR
jgi:hypothetical protein